MYCDLILRATFVRGGERGGTSAKLASGKNVSVRLRKRPMSLNIHVSILSNILQRSVVEMANAITSGCSAS